MWFTLNVNFLERHEVGQLKCRTGAVLPKLFSTSFPVMFLQEQGRKVPLLWNFSILRALLQFTAHPESLSTLIDAHPARMDSLTEQYDSPLAEL